jgi:hypothetical protein
MAVNAAQGPQSGENSHEFDWQNDSHSLQARLVLDTAKIRSFSHEMVVAGTAHFVVTPIRRHGR